MKKEWFNLEFVSAFAASIRRLAMTQVSWTTGEKAAVHAEGRCMSEAALFCVVPPDRSLGRPAIVGDGRSVNTGLEHEFRMCPRWSYEVRWQRTD